VAVAAGDMLLDTAVAAAVGMVVKDTEVVGIVAAAAVSNNYRC
jgi:hypothetical protein